VIGQVINYRYEVLEKIGDGCLFSVYRARDKVLNRLVALKVLRKELTDRLDFAQAVCRGYHEAAPLAHSGIVRLFEADCASDSCFVACEYSRGMSLKDRVKRAGPVPVPLALEIVVPVLEALEYAHASKIVHGDLRPQDIIIGSDGEVKVSDFGLSTALIDYPAVAGSFPMRSVHYQAPEVVEGAPPTAASDLYSVGIILYEMLTGQLPFDGPTAPAIALKKVRDLPAAPRNINAAIPRSLNDIILAAIDPSAENRYTSASAMLSDLRRIRDGMRLGTGTEVEPHAAREEARPEPEPRSDSFKVGFAWLIALFVVVVLVTLGVTMLAVGPRAEIPVPNLLGKTWDEAESEAQQRSIELVDEGRVFSDIYEDGKIAQQDPAAGNLPRGRAVIKVKISKGPSRVEVPDLIGLPEAEANEAAVRAQFTIGKVTEEYSEKTPINSVISQEPPPRVRREPGTAVDLVLSLGPKPVNDSELSSPTTDSRERRLKVDVEVNDQAEKAQSVRIVVNDNNGEQVAYEQLHEPGDSFSVPVSVVGSSARIRVYVGDKLVSDATY